MHVYERCSHVQERAKEQEYKRVQKISLSAVEYMAYKTNGRKGVPSVTTIRERFQYLMKCRRQDAHRNSNASGIAEPIELDIELDGIIAEVDTNIELDYERRK